MTGEPEHQQDHVASAIVIACLLGILLYGLYLYLKQ